MIPRMQACATLRRPVFTMCAVLILLCGAGRADAERVADPDAIGALIHALDGPEAAEFPLVYRAEGGFIQFLAAPPQARFTAPSNTAKAVKTPETVAQEFLNHHRDAFGLPAEGVELRLNRVVTREAGAFVRLDQYYSGLPVLGGQVIVYLDEALNVLNVNADVLRDTAALEKTYDALTPVLTAVQAVDQAIAHNALVLETEPERFSSAGDPEQVIFEPKLLSMAGSTCLAWKVRLNDSKSMEDMAVLIHAGDGSMLLRFAEQAAARRREIYDTEQEPDLVNAKMVRKEGDPPVHEEDYPNAAYINTAYDYFGDCYDFYMNYHGRDSYDNAGSIIRAYVNYPMLNAYWDNQQHIMVIGNLFLSDDVLAHEFTHGVTKIDSDLIYYSYAGAITEMYSDLGGEFVDLTNGRGDDSPEMRWYLGEDMEFKLSDIRGLDTDEEEGGEDDGENLLQNKEEVPGIRYMKDPTVFEEPDRLGSPFLWNPFSYSDLGGVHSNCGVGNKLIYLLTDGDTFNNQSVKGMGIPKVADLFYAARPMLSPTADYFELYHALLAASVLLNFTAEERANIIAGARAVEIEPPDVQVASIQGLRNFRALPTSNTSGNPVIGLKWKNPSIAASVPIPEDAVQITLYRSVTDFPTGPGDGLLLPMEKSEEAYLDTEVQAGTTYYYTLVVQVPSLYEEKAHAKALAGNSGMNVYTEVFGKDLYLGANPFDLSYSQFMFRPVLPPPPGGDDPYLGAMDFSDYEVTRVRGVYELPVQRNEAGGAYDLTNRDNDVFVLPLGDRVFPFFGKAYNELYVSANGYVLLADAAALAGGTEEMLYAILDTPSLAAHFALPRIAALFTDLAPHIGGAVWAKVLPDRIVITYENVAVKPGADEFLANPSRVTAQIELFDSGHIRITYLDVAVGSGIVGLSDGRGVPEEPSIVYGNILDGFNWADFSGLRDAAVRMSLNPVEAQVVPAGGEVSFTITAEVPAAMPGMPVLFAVWDGPGPVPFADYGNGSGRFYWKTAYEDAGTYTARVFAELGGQRLFQDVRLVVGREFNVSPSARNLRLSTNMTGEDPAVNRSVAVGTPLTAYYEYYHPYAEQVPLLYGPGASMLYWFRNGQLLSAFTNIMHVPASVVNADDVWYFMVKPASIGGLTGTPVLSPVITVLGVPIVEQVVPGQGLTIGGDRVTIQGRRFSNVLSVTFDGVPATGIQSAGSTELSVITPIHAAGPVTVAVETPGGIGRLVDAFTYVGDQDEPKDEDEVVKEGSLFGCGPREKRFASLWYDLMPAALVAFILAGRRLLRRNPSH